MSLGPREGACWYLCVEGDLPGSRKMENLHLIHDPEALFQGPQVHEGAWRSTVDVEQRKQSQRPPGSDGRAREARGP